MNATTWFFIGATSGMAFLFICMGVWSVVNKRMSEEGRAAVLRTNKLLIEANQHRERIASQLACIADELAINGKDGTR